MNNQINFFHQMRQQEIFLFHPTGSGKTKKTCNLLYSLFVGNLDYIYIIIPSKKLLNTWKEEMIQTLINPDYFEIITLRDFVNNSKLKEGRLAFVLDEVHNIIPKTFMSKNRRGTKRKYEDGENDYDISEMDDLEETTIGRKKRYFDILKNTFRENISRIIIALSATPFSSDLTLESNSYKELFDSVFFPETNIIDYFAKRVNFIDDDIYTKFPCKLLPFSNERQDEKIISSHEIDNVWTVGDELRISNLLESIHHFPIITLPTLHDNLQQMIECINYIKKKKNRPTKHFIITYHIETANKIYELLSTYNFRIYQVYSSDDYKEILFKINEYNNNTHYIDTILISTMFISEGLTLKNTDAMHSFEICEQHVATHTFQALGRVCRIGSHNKPDDINENNFVYLFMYTVPMEKFQINMALNKENTFRNFFQQVKIRQNIIFQENKDKVIPVQQSFILSKNIESSLMYQNEKVPIAKINLDMKLYQSSSFIDLLSTIFNTSIYDFTCCNAVLNKLGNTIIDSSAMKSFTIIYSRYNEKKSYLIRQFIIEAKLNINDIFISGINVHNLSRHIVNKDNLNAIQLNKKLGSAIIKGAQLKSFNGQSLKSIYIKLLTQTNKYNQTKIDEFINFNISKKILTIFQYSVENNLFLNIQILQDETLDDIKEDDVNNDGDEGDDGNDDDDDDDDDDDNNQDNNDNVDDGHNDNDDDDNDVK